MVTETGRAGKSAFGKLHVLLRDNRLYIGTLGGDIHANMQQTPAARLYRAGSSTNDAVRFRTVLHVEAGMPAREFPMSEMIHERCSR